MPSHIFKQIEGAVGVDRKIGKGLFSGPIVRGLGGRMNNKIKIMTLKYVFYLLVVSDVCIMMYVRLPQLFF